MSESKSPMSSEQARESSRSSGERRRSSKSARAERVVVRNMAVTVIHRRLLGLVVMSALLAVIVCVASFAIATRKVPPQYIQVQSDGSLLPVAPLSVANVDDAGIGAFALEAARAVNTYDYLNWRNQINSAQTYFTPDGWTRYKDELTRVGTMRAVEARKQIVTFSPSGPVRIASKGVGPDGLFTWDVELPSTISYVGHVQQGNSSSSNRQEGVVRLRIKRIPLALSDRGVAISGYGYTLTR